MLLKGVPWDNAKEGFSGWGSHPEWAVTLWSWEVGCAQLRELSPCHTPSKCGQGTWAAVWPLNVAEQRERNRIATWRKPVWHLCPFSTWRRQHSSKKSPTSLCTADEGKGNVVLGIFACFCSSTNWLSWQGGVLGNAARREERTRSLKRLLCCLWAVYVSCKRKWHQTTAVLSGLW